ncbi:hypothetical protein C3E78_16070 [Aeromicrobium chenweiae]|uniref:Uncharacterized protein n=2 Tax=Aeromicrobium chenweiae TaxID=2079793 RepID=A0A2S0WQG2_9ACTN|nr:hypothetical protein C3E78_16070 [Aeromicrobium chenweiae]
MWTIEELFPGTRSARGIHISVRRGREFIELIEGTDYVRVLTDAHDLPESLERGDSPKGRWVRLAKADLDRRFARNVTAMWDGQRVAVTGSTGELAHIGFNGSSEWAEEHDLHGSQYEGWLGSVPAAELSDVQVVERELS